MARNRKPHVSPGLKVLQFAFSRLGPIFPRVFGNWAYHLWFSTTRFKTPAHEQEADNSAQRITLDINDVPVSVLVWGKAPFILFIHGWNGRGTQAAPFLNELLASNYGVLSFDGPAHGKTPGNKTNILELANVILTLDKKYGPFEAAITHSFGGMVAAYTMSLGVTFSKVVCFCPPDSTYAAIDNFTKALLVPSTAAKVMLDKLIRKYGINLIERVSTVNNVSHLDNKALIIHDEDDTDLPWQSGQIVAKAWKGSRFIKTRGLGHRRILRDPDVVQTATNFIISD